MAAGGENSGAGKEKVSQDISAFRSLSREVSGKVGLFVAMWPRFLSCALSEPPWDSRCVLRELYAACWKYTSETEKSLKCRRGNTWRFTLIEIKKPGAHYLNHLCCIYFSRYCDRMPDKSYLRKGRFVWPSDHHGMEGFAGGT